MSHDRTFAGFDSSFDKSDYILVGVPYDKTSSFRIGSYKATEEVRDASYCFEPYLMEYDICLDEIDLHDAGDIDGSNGYEKLKEDISETVSKIVSEDKFPIILGGEHSISPPVVSSIQTNFSDLEVIILDAHLDFRDTYEGIKYNHATVSKRISEIVGIENITIVGVRSMASESTGKKKPIFFTAEQMEKDGCVEDILQGINGPTYLSMDMDVIDPSFAPGVGNPEPFGLSSVKMKDLLCQLSPHLIGMDIVEINPKYDCSNTTSNLGARLIYELIGSREKKGEKK
ncbi:MAG: agmatinase [Candidatus Thermoplasmatota archaeon]